jgi:hypothetical protein
MWAKLFQLIVFHRNENLLVCNWLHSVGQNHFYVMMLLYREAALSRVYTSFLFFKEDSVRISRQLNSVPLQPSRRRDILSGCSIVQASSVRTTRTFHLDLPLCREASNWYSLHPSGHFSSTSGCHSVFDQPWDFFPNTDMGRQLQPSGRCEFSSGHAHS